MTEWLDPSPSVVASAERPLPRGPADISLAAAKAVAGAIGSERPSPGKLDPADPASLVRHVAAENLHCARTCCADETTPEQIADFEAIRDGRVPDGRHVWLSLHPNWKKEPRGALALLPYFEVWLEDTPQPESRRAPMTALLRHVATLAKAETPVGKLSRSLDFPGAAALF